MVDNKVSVIMSAYNAESTIAEAIESILNQTFPNLELLIANDGSQDRTQVIIDTYAQKDTRIRTFKNPQNIGLLYTWNNLLPQTTGEFITWQDADDYSYPQRLEKMVHAFESDPELMLCGTNFIRFLGRKGKVTISNFPTSYNKIMETVRIKNKLPFLGGSRMMRRDLLAEFPSFRTFFDRIGWEDKDYILRVSEKYKVINLSDVLYEYRYTRDSASRYLSEEYYRKIFAEDIGFFLARQRWRDGVDGLMDGGNQLEFEGYLTQLEKKFLRDKSILDYHTCLNKLNNRDYWFALKDAMRAVRKKPLRFANYILLIRVVGSAIRFNIWSTQLSSSTYE